MSTVSSTYTKLMVSQEQRRRCEALAQPKAQPNRSGDLVPSRKVVGGGFGMFWIGFCIGCRILSQSKLCANKVCLDIVHA